MDKLTQKHLEAIEHDDCWIANECTPPDFEVEIAAQKSAEITKEVAIKFGDWLRGQRPDIFYSKNKMASSRKLFAYSTLFVVGTVSLGMFAGLINHEKRINVVAPINDETHIMHDDDKNITCWYVLKQGYVVTCLPDKVSE